MEEYYSYKKFDGYSTCFRQPKADSHCKYIHGYALEFHCHFKGRLDDNNWVLDFGGFKEFKEKMKYWFDHTLVIDKDDPIKNKAKELQSDGYVQLRIMNGVGCEKFAEFVAKLLQKHLLENTDGRVTVVRVECMENSNNKASYYPNENL
tara:strand:- start:167 stop:613 length:447 start_codon:yes stop_codon:yes gene_type:complete